MKRRDNQPWKNSRLLGKFSRLHSLPLKLYHRHAEQGLGGVGKTTTVTNSDTAYVLVPLRSKRPPTWRSQAEE